MKQFSSCVEDALFKLSAHRDDIHINYKMEEVQITAVDELYVEQNVNGSVTKQIARVRLFFLGFLTGTEIIIKSSIIRTEYRLYGALILLIRINQRILPLPLLHSHGNKFYDL